MKDGSNTTTNIFAGMTQKQLIAQQSSKNGTFVYTHGLNDRYGNPMIEKIRHGGSTAFVEHDPVTGNPLFLRDVDKKSVHMYISDPVDSDIRLVKDDGATSTYKEFDPYGARDEKVTVVPRDVFDPFRYRFGLVDRGGTGRYLFGVRFYDPRQGVWTQQDSLDAPLDPNNANRYAYAGSDPVNNFDPTGRAWQGGASFCFVACFSIGATWSDDTDVKNWNVGFGLGPRASVEGYMGHTGAEPSNEESLGTSGTCGGALGFGANGGIFIDAMNPKADGQANLTTGAGLGCSAIVTIGMPLE